MSVIKGLSIHFIGLILWSLLFALCFRFPVPMGGTMGPLGEISVPAMQRVEMTVAALHFYARFGGFLLPVMLSVLATWWLHRASGNSITHKQLQLVQSSLSFTLILLLSTSDWLFGAW